MVDCRRLARPYIQIHLPQHRDSVSCGEHENARRSPQDLLQALDDATAAAGESPVDNQIASPYASRIP
ncbi:hypothetical protein Emag_006855 [Eimeria magna]